MDPQAIRDSEKWGDWTGPRGIITYTNKFFSYDLPCDDDICIEDIAHALSHLCRYTGHTNLFYSVAQHSLLVSEKMPCGPEGKLVGLLHDAAEAYTNDLASPLRAWLREETNDYDDLQEYISAAIFTHFGIEQIPDEVRTYDKAAGLFEAEAFMGLTPEQLERHQFPMHLRELWTPWCPREYAATAGDAEMGEVERAFLERFEELMKLCGKEHLV